MEPLKPIFSFGLGGFTVDITPDIVVQWVIIALVAILAWWATRNLKVKPSKKQVVVESIYTTIRNVVLENVGENYTDIIPFIGSMGIYLLLMNLVGLIGVVPPTKNFSVTLGMALITFFVVQTYAIKKHGVKSYMKGYIQPIPVMLPINLLERVMLPVSLSLRLFGNVLAATFIIELVYENLHKIAWIAQIGLPIALHGYFDVFDGVIQMVIFVMLTMINIKIVSEH
ncbi:F0F1 ATP synthase subunit A [Clostridium septicum]|uniref:ATP synthase subunit a n=1 Tax=Clostridium septicum TaxID=1504 RepID=A0A9N7JL67_CLOSE|nr:F0F1 ATP synthase subunit A [Clostridium septicum]AYE34738.1 F0F1 ATP synthase subunit A [Clostridium septicum]MDU1312753.1 F0F1 ATP synthase subunit A [Clostridium septicum]QAS60140.1 F0F1 ATP synthase subunit A [Clostridium septicum]UEC20615.1 F0F1 ATP synthase subunit A [Clostridium septicum]USS01331.1 F0F1 ATP synthase subunit A [Clostridium septicum]